MTEDLSGVEAGIEKCSQVSDLLTQKGLDARFAPYITGNVVSKERGGFFGRRDLVEGMADAADRTGVVVVQGGFRSGKTSLVEAVGDELVSRGVANKVVFENFQVIVNHDPEMVMAEIEDEITRVRGAKKGKRPKLQTAAILVDELEAYDPSKQPRMIELFKTLRDKGHKVVVATIGDIRTDTAGKKELSSDAKRALSELAGEAVTINRLFTDAEIRELLVHGSEPLFTDVMLRYLTHEAGGHPYLANALAQHSFDLLNIDETQPRELPSALRRELAQSAVIENFGPVVDTIMDAGFDPLTWEWKGTGNMPDVNVYRNMIPKGSSSVFRDWLVTYLQKKRNEGQEQ